MIEAFKVDMKLFRKQINLSGQANIIKFYSVILAILVGVKYLTTLPPNTFPVKELLALVIAFLGVFKIRTDTISKNKSK